MNLSNLRAPKKANSNKKRVGRGMGSGMGKTSTRGHKGQRSRSGFTNIFRTEYTILNLDRIAELGEAEVTLESLVKAGLAKDGALVKVLGDGELKKKVNVQAHKFSKSAQEKITKAGGKAEVIGAA
jgi:large subunit ribosomal protein L15